jgi:hypothetical protein
LVVDALTMAAPAWRSCPVEGTYTSALKPGPGRHLDSDQALGIATVASLMTVVGSSRVLVGQKAWSLVR